MRLLTLARDLKRRKSRERESLFVVEGVRAVEELLRSPLTIEGLLIAPKLTEAPRGEALVATAHQRPVEVQPVDDKDFRSAADTDSPQGVIAIARIPSRAMDQLNARGPLRVLLLDAVQDPGNVGTMLRTAAALGVSATIALPGTVDLWNAKVVRSAMGAHFHYPAFHASWLDVQEFLLRTSTSLWCADADGESVTGSAPERLALAVGNEGGGLSTTVRAAASRVVAVPISAAVESLNVAVATGILLHELRA